jgi:hypothetical protein
MKDLLNDIQKSANDLQGRLELVTETFITEEQYDNSDDIIYDSPRVWEVSKHQYHIEFVVMSIDNGIVTAGSLGEDYGYFKKFNISELSLDEMISIADLC